MAGANYLTAFNAWGTNGFANSLGGGIWNYYKATGQFVLGDPSLNGVATVNNGPFSGSVVATDYSGATMDICYENPGDGYTGYQDIQLVYDSKAEQRGVTIPFLDGDRSDAEKDFWFIDLSNNGTANGFYYTKTQVDDFTVSSQGNILSFELKDTPGLATGFFVAETTLVGRDASGNLTPLGTYTWGYLSTGNGIQLMQPVFTPTPPGTTQGVININNNHNQ